MSARVFFSKGRGGLVNLVMLKSGREHSSVQNAHVSLRGKDECEHPVVGCIREWEMERAGGKEIHDWQGCWFPYPTCHLMILNCGAWYICDVPDGLKNMLQSLRSRQSPDFSWDQVGTRNTGYRYQLA